MDVVQDAPHTVILTEDEMSLYLQATTQPVWAPRGQTPVVRVEPSRQKTNFYGSLNLRTGDELVLRTDHVNGATTAFYLNCLLETYPAVPLLLFWDRAAWHRGAAVEQVRHANPRLEVFWYPVAMPELNPQEHVWKDARSHVSHNHPHERLSGLVDHMETYLSETHFPSAFLEDYGYEHLYPMFI